MMVVYLCWEIMPKVLQQTISEYKGEKKGGKTRDK